MKRNAFIFALVFGVMLASCVKDRLYDLPLPAQPDVVIVAVDWTNRSETASVPAEYTLRHVCCEEREFSLSATAPSLFPLSLEEGRHTFLARNTADKIDVNGHLATVAAAGEERIDPLPGYFFTALREFAVGRGDTTRVTLPMRQRVRDLCLELTLTDGNPERVAEITGSLAGVAAQFDLEAQCLTGEAKRVDPPFIRDGALVTARLRLMGVAGQGQLLSLRIDFTDGSVQQLQADLTAQFVGFEDEMTLPLTIRGNLSIPAEPGLSASISDWTVGENDEIEIH